LEAADDQSEEERIRETALRYTQHFPSLNPSPIEAYLSVLHTLRVHSVAIERYLQSLDLPKPISDARHTVLRTLYFADGNRLSQNEVSRELGVSRTNITNLIDALERDGLVARAVNPADRRTNYVQLTTAGLEFCSSFIPAVAQFMASVFEDLNERELDELNALLAQVRAGMYGRYFGEDVAAESSTPTELTSDT
jgi:DNA-binding MarR family transcriptional regulator